jgi:hypothetical protein
MLTTIKAAKTAVSALRRELKDLPVAPAALSHSQAQQLLARVLGFKNWDAWRATLADEPVAAASRYPLANTGAFDFIAPGESGSVYDSRLRSVQGTSETVLGTANVNSACRTDGGEPEPEYAGDTKIHWDTQETLRDAAGRKLWVSDDGGDVSASRLVLLPEDYWGDPVTDEELPVRRTLVRAVHEWLCAQPRRDGPAIERAQEAVGYRLTNKEVAALQALL